MLDSVQAIWAQYVALTLIEWTLTVLFTIEFGLRLMCSPAPKRYVGSFFGVVLTLSVLPTYWVVFSAIT